MAKLHSYYVLCPLLDQKSFLGVSQAKHKNCVIITLGRNVVNIYRLTDQKQIGGWTSKDHITSGVIYDSEKNSYVGIFNNNIIKMWNNDSENLDKIKKHKFPINILKIIPRAKQPALVIFSNGNCASLPYAIDNRKTYEGKPVFKEMEAIVHTAHYSIGKTDYICYIVKNKDTEIYEIINCPLKDDLGGLDTSKLTKIKVSRDGDVYVVGEHFSVEDVVVYFLWSDSKMTAYYITKKLWRTIGTVPWISTLNRVSITWMGKDHLILFGHNTDQDGSILIAYNIILGVGSCKYPMKMYTEDAKLYCIKNHILLEATNHIGMLPYILEPKRNISNLLGSHEVTQDEQTEIANWDTPRPSFNVAEEIKEVLQHGLTERSMCSQIIPPLLEKGDFKRVLRVIKDFNDVPESVLVLLLNYIVKLVKPKNINVSNPKEFGQLCSEKSANAEKLGLLDYIFQISFSDALLIPYLRNGLVLDDALFVMSYITHLLVNSDKVIDSEYESKLLDWCILLMDAFYQQYLLTKDEKVTQVLNKTRDVVTNLITYLNSIDKSLPLINKVLYGKFEEEPEASSYSIELMLI